MAGPAEGRVGWSQGPPAPPLAWMASLQGCLAPAQPAARMPHVSAAVWQLALACTSGSKMIRTSIGPGSMGSRHQQGKQWRSQPSAAA